MVWKRWAYPVATSCPLLLDLGSTVLQGPLWLAHSHRNSTVLRTSREQQVSSMWPHRVPKRGSAHPGDQPTKASAVEKVAQHILPSPSFLSSNLFVIACLHPGSVFREGDGETAGYPDYSQTRRETGFDLNFQPPIEPIRQLRVKKTQLVWSQALLSAVGNFLLNSCPTVHILPSVYSVQHTLLHFTAFWMPSPL